ncbi:MAG: GNAT family N-acetyltransferase [Bacillota bacterium]
MSARFCIRGMKEEDCAGIARLCGQLGYPATSHQVRPRIANILARENHKVFVAEAAVGKIIGWVHVHSYPLLESDLMAEIGGLVVNQDFRRMGVGRALMRYAEEWARTMGCANVSVRSNVIFYEGVGYTERHKQRVAGS